MTFVITKPGIYDVPEEEYHADPVPSLSLSSSGAKKMYEKTPLHYWTDRRLGSKSTSALKLGSAAHIALLEPERFDKTYFVMPEGLSMSFAATKALKEEFGEDGVKELKATAKSAKEIGQILLSYKDAEIVKGMKEGMGRKESILSKFITCPKEQSAFWFDDVFRIWRRARFDYLPNEGRIFADYKTTTDLSDDAINKAVSNFGWHQQAAWYLDAIKALGLHDKPVFMFIMQEKSPPYEIRLVELDYQSIADGQVVNGWAMDQFARGIETGEWQGYPSAPYIATRPRYAETIYDAKQEAGDFALTHRLKAEFYQPEIHEKEAA